MAKERKCPIKECPYQGRKVVPFMGSMKTELMVVGESPSWEDEKAGLPFQGTHGKLLGIEREN